MPSYLKGWKTYAIAAAGVVLAGLKATGHIDAATYEVILGILGAFGLATVRAAVGEAIKSGK